MMKYPNMYVPVDRDAMVKAGRITEAEAKIADDIIDFDMMQDASTARDGGMSLSKLISLDMIATSAANGWNRPIYFASTVPTEYYLGLSPYLRSTGMAFEVSPIRDANGMTSVNTDKMYRNVTERFRWGGIEAVNDGKEIYLDETVRRMVTSTRSSLYDLAHALIVEGLEATDSITDANKQQAEAFATDRYKKAVTILDLMMTKLPTKAQPFGIQLGQQVAELYATLAELTGDKALTDKALSILRNELDQYTQNVVYYQSLKPWQYMTLPATDRWIDQHYYLKLLQAYSDFGGDAEAYMQQAADKGVNFTRQASFLDS